MSHTAASKSASALYAAREAAALSNISVVLNLSAGGALTLGTTFGLPMSTTPATATTLPAAGIVAAGVITVVLAAATSTCVVLGAVALPAVLVLGPAALALPVLVGAGGA